MGVDDRGYIVMLHFNITSSSQVVFSPHLGGETCCFFWGGGVHTYPHNSKKVVVSVLAAAAKWCSACTWEVRPAASSGVDLHTQIHTNTKKCIVSVFATAANKNVQSTDLRPVARSDKLRHRRSCTHTYTYTRTAIPANTSSKPCVLARVCVQATSLRWALTCV